MDADGVRRTGEGILSSVRMRGLSAMTGSFREVRAAIRRRHWRKCVRRIGFVAVVMITNLSMIVSQTQAYMELQRAIHAPQKTTLGAGPWTHVTHTASVALRSLEGWVSSIFAVCDGPSSNLTLSPAGAPYPWQAAVPAGPYSAVNMANGNLFTTVPIVGWQSIGRPIQFSLFHNTLGDEPGLSTIVGEKWTHSYCRHLVYDGRENTYALYTDEGGSLIFSETEPHSGVYEPPAGFHLKLELMIGQGILRLTYKNQDVDEFDSQNGRLLRVLDASELATGADGTMLDYDCGLLASVTDSVGNELVLSRYNDGKLHSITAPDIDVTDSLPRVYELMYDYEAKIVEVSSARRTDNPNDQAPAYPMFWASFQTEDNYLIKITDYATEIECSNPELPDYWCWGVEDTRTVTEFIYVSERVDSVVLAKDTPSESELQFEYLFDSSIESSSVEVYPRSAVTTYYFDAYARLERIEDPLDRDVLQVEWDTLNNPVETTNVLGGVTEQTFDSSGNVLTVQPPVGGVWEYTYDSLNNITSITEPLDNVTSFEYEDENNPTRPTLINGPGVSDLPLAWGQGGQPGQPVYDLGRLKRSVNPNGVEQLFNYWTPDSLVPEDGCGKGQLWEASLGRGEFPNGPMSGAPVPVADRVSRTDRTGNPVATGQYICHSTKEGGTGLPNEPCESARWLGGEQPEGWYPFCVDGSDCERSYDADGNIGSCIDCGQGRGLQDHPRYGGKGELLYYPHGEGEGDGYYFEYDPLGRKTAEFASYDESRGGGLSGSGMALFPNHQVFWEYMDAYGEITRTYCRVQNDWAAGQAGFFTQPSQDPPIPGYATITTTWSTDLAGRITSVDQNGAVTEYEYMDSTSLPAVVVSKPDLTSTEYYVDVAGQVVQIVHKDCWGEEALAIEYYRDLKGRVTDIYEYADNGAYSYHTEFTYGHGHLTEAELCVDDACEAWFLEDGSARGLYYSWFAELVDSAYFTGGGDPNRLVKEIRTGDGNDESTDYYREYRYDAGGNRLVMLEKEPNGVPVPSEWGYSRLTRYNYAYLSNYDPTPPNMGIAYYLANPRDPWHDSSRPVGEPVPGAELDTAWSQNSYDLNGEGYGQDKLLSYTQYEFDENGGWIEDQPPVYTAYEYNTDAGMMSRRISWNGITNTLTDTHFSYYKGKLGSAAVDEIFWEDPEVAPDLERDRQRFVEIYVHNPFGERFAVMHSPRLTPYDTFFQWGQSPQSYPGCITATGGDWVNFYDYAEGPSGGRELVCERRTSASCTHLSPCTTVFSGFVSVFQWGPMGLVARLGASLRNGEWNASGGEECDPEDPNSPVSGAFDAEDPFTMSAYTYMVDHMGNVVGLADSATGEAQRQVFDAFGVNVGGYATFACAADQDWADDPWHLEREFEDPSAPSLIPIPPPPPCPLPPEREPQAVARMQTGLFNWRGGEGSQTSLVLEDMPESSTFLGDEDPNDAIDPPSLRWSALQRPSTGLVYMQARYYEPETGRFTQSDPMPYGFETFLAGQNNRWVYCANDPVNGSDPSGQFVQLIGAVLTIVGTGFIIASMFTTGRTSTILGAVGGLVFSAGLFLVGNLAGFALAWKQLLQVLALVSPYLIMYIANLLMLLGYIMGKIPASNCGIPITNVRTIEGLKLLWQRIFALRLKGNRWKGLEPTSSYTVFLADCVQHPRCSGGLVARFAT